MTAITLHSVTLGVFILISFMVFTMSLWVSKDAEILKKCWLDFSYPQINRIQALKNQREAEKKLEFGIFLAEYLHIKVKILNFLFWFFWLVLNICCFIEGHSAFFYKLDNNAIFIVWMLWKTYFHHFGQNLVLEMESAQFLPVHCSSSEQP